MAEPRPVHVLWSLQVGAALLGVLWWVSLTPEVRCGHLERIAHAEQATTRPPATLLTQATWLWEHRSARLMGMVGVLSTAALIGYAEGVAWRHRDTLAGVRLKAWTLGVCGLALGPGVVAGAVLAPWPIPIWPMALSVSAGSAVVLFLVGAGRPAIL